jgi:hypothetical protein
VSGGAVEPGELPNRRSDCRPVQDAEGGSDGQDRAQCTSPIEELSPPF